ncbi:MAG TPA: DUF58 domain-containing protein [Terriglobia bacterium]|nr:DUF58 domain-containing protein [Terriglobia bacterium]
MLSRLREKLRDQEHRTMVKTFSTAIGLLALALIAALYSSSMGREGRVLAAGVSAGIALSIALWVGFRFVPRLAASVDWDWLPFFSRYHITREGWIYFAAVTVVIFAAINTSNNLLYMVMSALLAVLLLSGFLSGLNFGNLRLDIRIPSNCFAGELFPISIQVNNEKLVFPSFSLNFEPEENAFQFSTFYIPVVRPQRHITQAGQARLNRRGRYIMNQIKSASRYPFGFFRKDKKYRVEAQCICYPEILPQERINFSVLDIQGSNQRLERGFGHDLYTIRDYVPADSARHVHWKASAKTAVLKTREYAAEENRRIVLAFDRFGRPGDAEKFEALVSHTASLAYHLIKDGVEVALVSDEWRTGYGTSEALLESILQYLALVNMSAAADPPDAPEAGLKMSLRKG